MFVYIVLVCIAVFGVAFESIVVNSQTVTLAPPLPSATASSSVRYALLLKELSTVTAKRSALQNTFQQYRTAFDDLQSQLAAKRAACTCYAHTAVTFTAHLDKDIAILGANQAIPFDNVTLNVGGAYDGRHSQFRAPYDGIYEFKVTMSTNAGYLLNAAVMLNNNAVVKVATGNDNQFNTATNAVIVHMNSGDDLWIQHDPNITDSNRLYYGEGFLTTFSGHLIAKD